MILGLALEVLGTIGTAVWEAAVEAAGERLVEKVFGSEAKPEPLAQDRGIAIVLQENRADLAAFADVQAQWLQLQQAQAEASLAQSQVLAREQMALQVRLQELTLAVGVQQHREVLAAQQQAQTVQIQADWDRQKMATVLSRFELERLDPSRPLFVCSKLRVGKLCPDYFDHELADEAARQLRGLVSSLFGAAVQFHSAFFDAAEISETHALQLRPTIPHIPTIMAFGEMGYRWMTFDYVLWGCGMAEKLGGQVQCRLNWQEMDRRLREGLAAGGRQVAEIDRHAKVGDWISAVQQLYACYLLDCYALVDGPDPWVGLWIDRLRLGDGEVEQLAQPYRKELRGKLLGLQKARLAALGRVVNREQEAQVRALVAEEERAARELEQQRRDKERQEEAERQQKLEREEAERRQREEERRKAEEAQEQLRQESERLRLEQEQLRQETLRLQAEVERRQREAEEQQQRAEVERRQRAAEEQQQREREVQRKRAQAEEQRRAVLSKPIVVRIQPPKRGLFGKQPDPVKLELLPIPGGTFWMGQTEAETRHLKQECTEEQYQKLFANELPRHRVTVPPFWMGRYPVTQAQYEAVMGNNPATQYKSKFVGPDQPVVGVNWDQAIAFCQKLTELCREQLQGGKIVLPTEAQWEYACRAGTETAFYFGDRLEPHQANFDGNFTYNGSKKGEYRQVTTPVGSFPANAWGLQDLHGNVWEWCQDEFHESYAEKPEALKRDGSIPWEDSNSNVLDDDRSGQIRVLRGGSWSNYPRYCRSADRDGGARDYFYNLRGFRLVLASRTS